MRYVAIGATALAIIIGIGRVGGGGGGGGGAMEPWLSAVVINYSCSQSRFAAVTSAGANNGTSWANAWSLSGVSWATVSSGTSGGNSCLFIDGGSSGQTYSVDLAPTVSGTNDTHRIVILSGQDAGHDGKVTFASGHRIAIGNHDYVTVDGEGSDASTQHFVVASSDRAIEANSGTNPGAVQPVVRYVETQGGCGDCVDARWTTGGTWDHLYVHDVTQVDPANTNDAEGFNCNASNNAATGYDQTVIQNSHFMLYSTSTEGGFGPDGIQGCTGLGIHGSLIEDQPGGFDGNGCSLCQHQDLIQNPASYVRVVGSVFKDGGDSSGIDYGCASDDVNHQEIYNNVFIHARGGADIRYYTFGSGPCNSFDNIHIDNNVFVDHTCCVSGYGAVSFGDGGGAWAGSNPTVTNSEIQNNVFYNDTASGSPSISIHSSTGFTASDWHVDYNNLSGGSNAFDIDGTSPYTQTHASTCTPTFSGYRLDNTPYSQTWTSWGKTDDSLAAGDTCLANNGTTQSVFSTDYLGTSRPQGASWDIGAFERVGG